MTNIETMKPVLDAAVAVEQNAEECMGDDGMVMVVPLDLYNEFMEAIAALRQAISEAEQADQFRDATKMMQAEKQEPVAWLFDWEHEGEIVTGWVTQDFQTTKFNGGHNVRPLYAVPPQREWVSLTDDEIHKAWAEAARLETTYKSVYNAIEAKLKEKNS
ncbi:MAG: hypothetical protein ACR2IJ_09200 [Fluviibacter sp.]